MNMSNIISLTSKQIGLAKERENQSINTIIITDKDKINVIYLYKDKNNKELQNTPLILGSSYYNSGIHIPLIV